MSLIGAPRPTPEPSPPLQALLDLPLKHDVGARAASFDALEARVRAGGEGDWPSVYEQAVALLDGVLADLGNRVEGLQQQLTFAEDPNELRARLVQQPQQRASQALNEARAAVQKVSREWADRIKRQGDQVTERCIAEGTAALTLTEAGGGATLGVDPAWWGQYAGWVARCSEDWVGQATAGAEAALKGAVGPATALALEMGGVLSPPPAAGRPPPADGLGPPPAGQPLAIPSLPGALFAFLRTHLMSVGIAASALSAMGAAVGAMVGSTMESGSATVARGALMLLAAPVVGGLGYVAARREQAGARTKAEEQQRQVLTKALEEQVIPSRGDLDRTH